MSLLHLIIFKNFFSLRLCLGLPFLLDFLLLAYPSIYFNSSQFYLIDTRTFLEQLLIFSNS